MAHRLLDELSEEELRVEYERLRAAVAGEQHVDEWGDLNAWSDAAGRGTFEHLDAEEAKVGFSWEKYRRA